MPLGREGSLRVILGPRGPKDDAADGACEAMGLVEATDYTEVSAQI